MDEHTRKDEQFAKKALEEGLVTEEQLEDAKQAQAAMRKLGIDKPLADVMIDKKLIGAIHVRAIEKDSVVGAGHRIAGFELVRKLGQGAMGSVYLARQVTMDRLVALKVLPPRLAADSSYVERFLREARSSAKLSHAHIVQGIDAGEESGLYYFAMEYVQGGTCQKILDEKGPLAEKKAVSIGRQVASALAHAHAHGLVHRDVKPENIIIDEVTGDAKLCDLGLAKSRGEAGATGGGKIAVGTPHYISPEQARGDEDIDIRADIYGLGATLYALVTGSTPFDGSPAVVLTKHLTETCPSPRDLNHKVSPGLDAVVRRMMARHRTHRYLNPKELLGDLERLEAGKNPLALRFESESTVAPPRPPKRTARKERALPRRSARNIIIPAGVAVLMVAMAVAAYLMTGRKKPPRARRRPRRPVRLVSRKRPRGGARVPTLPEGDLVLCGELVQDAWITPDQPDKNYSSAEEAHLQSSTPDRYLVRFDLSEVPKESKIASALFVLNLKERDGKGKAFAHEILAEWDPETVTYKSPWEKPGMVRGKDYTAPPIAGLLPAGEDKFEADITLLVEKWLSGGKNLGIVLVAEPKKSLHCRFGTPRAGLGKGPALTITFAELEEEPERDKSPGQLALEGAAERARKLASEKKFAEAIKVLDRIPKKLRDPVIESKIKFEKGAVVAAALAEFGKLAKSARKQEKKGRPDKAKGILKKALAWRVPAVTRRAKEEMKRLEPRKPKPKPAPPRPAPKLAARKKEDDRKKALEGAKALMSRGEFAEAAKLLREKGLGAEDLCADASLAAGAFDEARRNLPALVGAEEFKLTRKGIRLSGRVAKASGAEIVIATPQAGELSFALGELSPDDLLAVATYRVIDPKKLLAAHLGCAVLALRGGNASRARSILLKARKIAPSKETDRLVRRADGILLGAREERARALVAELERAHAEKQWRTLLSRYRDLKSAYEETKAFKARAPSIEKMAEEARAAVAPRPAKPARVEANWRKYVAGTLAAANSRLARLKKENRLHDMMDILEGLRDHRRSYELGLQLLRNPRDPYRGACENGQVDLACARALVAMGNRAEADKHLEALKTKAKGKEEWLENAADEAPKWADAHPESLKKLADLEQKRVQFPNESSIQWEICDVLGHPLRQFLRQRGELEVMLRKFAGNAEVRNGECNWRLLERTSLFGEWVAAVRFGAPVRENHPEHYAVKSGDCTWLVAEARKELRDYRGALELYQEILEKHPGHWSVTYQVVPVRIAECKRALGIR